jgi:NADPH:quinone reductase-like Zn-dependent oxidoreductase
MDRRSFLAGAAAAGLTGTASTARGDAHRATPSRSWEIGPKGGFDTMRLVTRSVSPGPGQVAVKVSCSAIAARDLAIARGWFLQDKPADLVPLSEGVGVVAAIGPGVTRVRPGDRVTCCHFATWTDGAWSPAHYAVDIGNTVDGWLAEYALLPESGLVALPDAISNETAATLAGSGVTAWHALNEASRCKPGDVVLTLGTGGVSTWGLLLAKAAGARVAITSSSDEKLARMRALGADVTVNYRQTPDWGQAIAAQTGGADIVLENVGRETLDQSMLACAPNARIVMIGTAPLPERLPEMPGFYQKNLLLKAISNGNRRMLADMARAVAANRIEAVIARTFEFGQVPEAFEYMAASSHSGKVLIRHPG